MEPWYDEGAEAQARAYERAQGLLFLGRFALLFALAGMFWGSGASRALGEGLRRHLSFPYAWPLVHLAFTSLAVFGYEALLFPLSVRAHYSLEKAYGRLTGGFGEWLRSYLVTLLFEIGLMAGGFTTLVALMRVFPSVWWLLATALYGALVLGLGEWAPAHLLPRLRPPRPADDPDLEEDLRKLGRAAGFEMTGAAWWDFEHQEELESVRLVGRGRRRRAVYSEWAWRNLSRPARVFLAARRMYWLLNRRVRAVQGLQLVLAAGVFLGGGWMADWAARGRGLPGATAPEAFPFLVVALFGCAAVAGMAEHAVARWMELRADAFALRYAGGAERLLECLREEFRQEPFAAEVPAWQVWLLRRQPTAARRAARASPRAPARESEGGGTRAD